MTDVRRLDRLRSVLFAPANREDFVLRLPERGADVVVLDCEDAVPSHAKEDARRMAAELVPRIVGQRSLVTVRVNAPSTEWFAADLAAIAEGVGAVVVPKIERLSELDEIARRLDAVGQSELGVFVGLETALGVADARLLLGHPRVVAAYFGAEDYIADLGGRRTASNAEVATARSLVALAGRLAGVPVVDQVVTAYADDDRFTGEAGQARDLGYAGKLCIHPRQVALASEAFSPTAMEIERARRLLDAYAAGQAAGRGAVSFEGQMVDEPLAAQARRILELADASPTG